MALTPLDPGHEFDRQVRTLLDLEYPAMSGLTEDAFVRLIGPLREIAVTRGASMSPPEAGRVPFVLVVARPNARCR